MFKKVCKFLMSLVVSFIFLEPIYAQDQFDSYTGVLQNEATSKEQLAKLDFIISRLDANNMRLMAVLSFYFGDFTSQEYISYHFDNVKYNFLAGTLVFDQPDQDMTVIVDQFKDGNLTANLRSATAGYVGKLVLKKGSGVKISRPLVQPVWGEYKGMCDGYSTILQIQTSRSTGDTSRVGNPFGTYEITGQRAEDDLSCGDYSSSCVRNVYPSGTYNFFNGTLNLYGRANDQECKVTDTGLICNGCEMKRVSKEAAFGQDFSFAKNSPLWTPGPAPWRDEAAINDEVTSIQGDYKGWVHHERLNVYQPVSFNLLTYQQSGSDASNQLRMSAVATLYFGSHGSEEGISYRFNERNYPLLSPQIVFERLDGDTDAIVQVTKISGGEISGIWYSMLYGRVGTFTTKKSGITPLPSGAKVMEKVAAKYDSPDWLLDLRVARESTPINTRNPFFPLNFKGYMTMTNGATPNIPISGGSYDFYTGKMTVYLGEDSLFSGTRQSRDRLLLKRPTIGPARPLQPHTPIAFRRTSP